MSIMPIELHCPSFLHAAYRDAKAAAGRFVTKLNRGATIEEAAGPLVPRYRRSLAERLWQLGAYGPLAPWQTPYQPALGYRHDGAIMISLNSRCSIRAVFQRSRCGP